MQLFVKILEENMSVVSIRYLPLLALVWQNYLPGFIKLMIFILLMTAKQTSGWCMSSCCY